MDLVPAFIAQKVPLRLIDGVVDDVTTPTYLRRLWSIRWLTYRTCTGCCTQPERVLIRAVVCGNRQNIPTGRCQFVPGHSSCCKTAVLYVVYDTWKKQKGYIARIAKMKTRERTTLYIQQSYRLLEVSMYLRSFFLVCGAAAVSGDGGGAGMTFQIRSNSKKAFSRFVVCIG